MAVFNISSVAGFVFLSLSFTVITIVSPERYATSLLKFNTISGVGVGTGVPSPKDTVTVSAPVLFALSKAVTVMLLSPSDDKRMLETLQSVVPLAVPLPPLSFSHVTLFMPLRLSFALPSRFAVIIIVPSSLFIKP